MKRILTLSLLFFSVALWAQPINDDCAGIIDLGVAPFCPDDVYFDNVGATPTDIGNDNIPNINSCDGLGPMQRDVWFTFIASDTIDDYTITVTGLDDPVTGTSAMINPQLAIYRGDCGFNDLVLLSCEAALLGGNEVKVNLDGLTSGLPYFIRVTDYSTSATPNWGSFKLCVDEKDPIIVLEDDVFTTLCSGEVYDSGGPDGDYSDNQNFTLTIQPPGAGCIKFTLIYYNIQAGSDFIRFFDGPNTASPQITQISGGFPGITGGGGVGFDVYAPSGTLTMQFSSNASVTLDGFYGVWECSPDPCDPLQVVQVDPEATEQDIIDAVSTPQTQVTIDTIICNDVAFGTFEGGDLTNLGMERGLVLSTGRVANEGFASGVNNPASVFASSSNGFPGDADLNFLSTGSATQDACVVIFDVFVATNELSFEYVFGSEEYPSFVNSSFNDIFAFLVSGPGIVGNPGIGGQFNMATLPAPAPPGTLVEINSVNFNENWEFYRNNQAGPSIVFGGLTSDYLDVKRSLTARADVIPCNTYKLKLAIADRGDSAYDSGVFVSEIKGGTPVLETVYNNGIDYIAEECSTVADNITIGLNSPQDGPVTYNVVIGGTATQNVDYVTNLPPQVTFEPGETEFSFNIISLPDGFTEGIETVEIMLVNNFGCGDVIFATLVIEIHDNLDVNILAVQDTAYVCANGELPLKASGAVNYFWTPASVFSNPSIADPIATPSQSQMVYVVGTLGTCVAFDSVYLEVVAPLVEIITDDPIQICAGAEVVLSANNNVGNSNLIWSPAATLSDPMSPVVTAIPTQTTTYTVQVEIEGCSATDEITVEVDDFVFPDIPFSDTTICQNYSVTLGAPVTGSGSATTIFTWTPNEGLSCDDCPNPIATPEETTTYTLFATSENNFCDQTASVTVTVIPADVRIVEPDSSFIGICLGETVDLGALSSTGVNGFEWIPDDGSLSTTTELNTIATPQQTTTYYATLETAGCFVIDSITVRVDSLPFGDITELIPDKEVYCEGEQITIISPVYEPSNFLGITHQWSPNIGLESPDSLWNLVITATETTNYIRISTNQGCVDTASVLITVIPTSSLDLTPQLDSICPGETVQFMATSPDEVDEWSWTPPNTLSCDDCPDPIATPTGSTTYSVQGSIQGCPIFASAFIYVAPSPVFNLNNTSICLGESVILNGTFDPNSTYSWLENGVEFSQVAQPEVSPSVTTTYTLIISAGGCEPIEANVTVEVVDIVTLTISQDTIVCIGDEVTLTATADAAGSFLWSPGGETTGSITVSPTETTTYDVLFTDAGCGVEYTSSVTVTVSPGFMIDSLIATPDSLFSFQPFDLQVFTTPENLPNNPAYIWYIGDVILDTTLVGQYAGNAIPVDIAQPVPYSVVIVDELGCNDLIEFSIYTRPNEFQMPNAFAPGGTNKTFNLVKTDAVQVVDFKIFNRWGQMVYDNDDNENGWDGTFKGEPAPMDAYSYIIILDVGNGIEQVLKGSVTLFR